MSGDVVGGLARTLLVQPKHNAAVAVANLQDDWDVSDSEKKKPAAAAPGVAAPVRKKKLKEKLAEKERIAVSRVCASVRRQTRPDKNSKPGTTT